MEFQLGELSQVHYGLRALFDQELDAKLQWVVSRDLAKIEEELRRLREIQLQTIEKHDGELTEDGAEYPSEEDEVAAKEEFKELLEETVQLDIVPVEFDRLEGVKLTGQQMLALSKVLEGTPDAKGAS